MRLRLATRGSPLALWQAERVGRLLRDSWPGLEVSLVEVSTTGDRQSTTPVWEMGGQGVFVREVQAAVLQGRADAAVHSAKDLQPVEAPGLCLAALPERADPRDALVGGRLAELGPGATVATGSPRRRAQLAAARPDLRFESLRGNIATRLTRVPPGGAIVVAVAAVQRLGLTLAPMEVLSTQVMLPQVAQGALAVECRADDEAVIELMAAIDDSAVRPPVLAERAFLSSLGGGCDLPVAGHAHLARQDQGFPPSRAELGTGEAILVVEGLVASADGATVVRRSVSGPVSEAENLGRRLGTTVMAAGGDRLMVPPEGGRP